MEPSALAYRQSQAQERTQAISVETQRVKELIFLGTGTSSSLPHIFCLARPTDPPCSVCFSSLNDPRSKNRRRNTSLLIRFSPNRSSIYDQLGDELLPKLPTITEPKDPEAVMLQLDELETIQKHGDSILSPLSPIISTGQKSPTGSKNRQAPSPITYRNVVIDCGKTFYESCLEWFLLHGCVQIDGVLLTHAHADALLGLDDLRHWTMYGVIQKHVDVYCDDETLSSVASTFPYLVDTRKATGGGAVSHLNFHKFSHKDIVSVDNLKFTPLPVQHGLVGGKLYGDRPYMALGYRFEDIVYISDVSQVPESTMPLLEGAKVLIIDALHPMGHYTSHFCLEDTLQLIRHIKPKYVYLTDLSHLWDHELGNSHLKQLSETDPSLRGIQMQLAYDGLRVVLNP